MESIINWKIYMVYCIYLIGTAWAPDDDDEGSYEDMLSPPAAERTRPSIGTIQLFYTTPPKMVSNFSGFMLDKINVKVKRAQ